MVLHNWFESSIFILVFHRILDFKTGLNFYSDPFFIFGPASRWLTSFYTLHSLLVYLIFSLHSSPLLSSYTDRKFFYRYSYPIDLPASAHSSLFLTMAGTIRIYTDGRECCVIGERGGRYSAMLRDRETVWRERSRGVPKKIQPRWKPGPFYLLTQLKSFWYF